MPSWADEIYTAYEIYRKALRCERRRRGNAGRKGGGKPRSGKVAASQDETSIEERSEGEGETGG